MNETLEGLVDEILRSKPQGRQDRGEALGCALSELQLCSGSLKDLSFVHLPRHGRASRDLPSNHSCIPEGLRNCVNKGFLVTTAAWSI